MPDYDNTNRGSIWKNEKKETDNHPDFNGSLDVNGVEYWVSAWLRKPDANPKAPALNFSIKPKEQQQGQQAAGAATGAAAGTAQNFDDDIPF